MVKAVEPAGEAGKAAVDVDNAERRTARARTTLNFIEAMVLIDCIP